MAPLTKIKHMILSSYDIGEDRQEESESSLHLHNRENEIARSEYDPS